MTKVMSISMKASGYVFIFVAIAFFVIAIMSVSDYNQAKVEFESRIALGYPVWDSYSPSNPANVVKLFATWALVLALVGGSLLYGGRRLSSYAKARESRKQMARVNYDQTCVVDNWSIRKDLGKIH